MVIHCRNKNCSVTTLGDILAQTAISERWLVAMNLA
jgi:hypothetical protein